MALRAAKSDENALVNRAAAVRERKPVFNKAISLKHVKSPKRFSTQALGRSGDLLAARLGTLGRRLTAAACQLDAGLYGAPQRRRHTGLATRGRGLQ